ncbi:hypothetical protein BS78_04G030300 [Paspalum vaginatum]|nr:hypothetical protein BS78_04G030300 [Paspalum vaginatum]
MARDYGSWGGGSPRHAMTAGGASAPYAGRRQATRPPLLPSHAIVAAHAHRFHPCRRCGLPRRIVRTERAHVAYAHAAHPHAPPDASDPDVHLRLDPVSPLALLADRRR